MVSCQLVLLVSHACIKRFVMAGTFGIVRLIYFVCVSTHLLRQKLNFKFSCGEGESNPLLLVKRCDALYYQSATRRNVAG